MTTPRERAGRLALGTAQFGMAYGVANQSGQLTEDAGRAVLETAFAVGIDTIDTAVSYGSSHAALGRIGVGRFRVVTKLPGYTSADGDVDAWVDRTVTTALGDLRVPSLYGLLLHHAADLAGPQGAAIHRAMIDQRDAGRITRLGVSVYGPDELAAVDRYEVDLVQAPYNVFDRRIADSGWLDRLADRGTEVHTRSVFLQGVLLMAPEERPAYFARWAGEFREWDSWCASHGVPAVEAALACVLDDARVDRVLVGVDGVAQLQEIAASARNTEGTATFDGPGVTDAALINPSMWKV